MKRQGFTVLEILFALSILTLAVTIITLSFSKLNSSQALDKSADLVVSILNEARALTLSSKGDSQYGIYFDASQVVLFKGATYSSIDPSNVITELNSLVGLRNITLSGGGASVVFERLTGNADKTGTVEVFLKTSPGIFKTVTINGTGIVGLN